MLYLEVFLISLIITLSATPLVRKASRRLGVVDRPAKRKINTNSVPTAGGLAIYFGFFASILFFLPFNSSLAGILLGGSLMLGVGLLDDIYELPALFKLVAQVLAASILVFAGIKIEFITNPFGGLIYLGQLATPLTILWIVSVTNIVNLIDGLDGLAAGVAGIAVLTLFIVALQEGQFLAAVLAIGLLGSCLGFLPYNFNPASIFMGDTGAMFTGYLLGAISIVGALKSAAAVTLFVPVLALGVPIFDTAFAIVRRVSNNKPISQADHGHLHHRLLAIGFDQRQAVLTVYAISLLLGLLAITINGIRFDNALVLIVVIITAMIGGARWLGIFAVDLPAEGQSLSE